MPTFVTIYEEHSKGRLPMFRALTFSPHKSWPTFAAVQMDERTDIDVSLPSYVCKLRAHYGPETVITYCWDPRDELDGDTIISDTRAATIRARKFLQELRRLDMRFHLDDDPRDCLGTGDEELVGWAHTEWTSMWSEVPDAVWWLVEQEWDDVLGLEDE